MTNHRRPADVDEGLFNEGVEFSAQVWYLSDQPNRKCRTVRSTLRFNEATEVNRRLALEGKPPLFVAWSDLPALADEGRTRRVWRLSSLLSLLLRS